MDWIRGEEEVQISGLSNWTDDERKGLEIRFWELSANRWVK